MAARSWLRSGECGMSAWVLQTGIDYPTLDDVQNQTGTGTIHEWTAPYPIQAWTLEQDTSYPTSRHVQNPTATGSLSEMEVPNPTWMWKLFGGYKYPYLEAVDNVDTSFPSQRYKEAITRHVIQTKLTGSLLLADGTFHELSDSDFVNNSLTIVSNMMPSGDYYLPGGVPMAELNMSLFREFEIDSLYDAKLNLSFWLLLPKTESEPQDWYEVPLGEFYVTDAVESSDTALSVTANDGMLLFNRVPFTDIGFEAGRFYSPDQIVIMCCSAAGVELGTSPAEIQHMINAQEVFEVASVDTSVETARDLLMHTCQLIGAFAYVDRFKKLRIRSVNTEESTRTIQKRNRRRSSISKIPYRTFMVRARATKYDGTNTQNWDQDIRAASISYAGVRPELPSNPLYAVVGLHGDETWQNRCYQMLFKIAMVYFNVEYIPCELDLTGDPTLQLGDWVTVETKDGAEVQAPITSFTFSYHRNHTITAAGRDAMAGVIRDQNDKAAQARNAGSDKFMDDLYRQLEELAIAQAIPYPIESSTGEWLITTTGEYLQYEYTEEEV